MLMIRTRMHSRCCLLNALQSSLSFSSLVLLMCQQEALKRQAEIVTKLTTMLTFIVFGPLCPLLMLAAPVWAATNHCTNYWFQRQQGSIHIGKKIAHKILGQQPTVLFGICAHFGQWVMVACIAADLQFSVGPAVLYAVACVAELAALQLYPGRDSAPTSHRQLAPEIELNAIVHSDWNRKISQQARPKDETLWSQTPAARGAECEQHVRRQSEESDTGGTSRGHEINV